VPIDLCRHHLLHNWAVNRESNVRSFRQRCTMSVQRYANPIVCKGCGMERFHYWFMGLVTVFYGVTVLFNYVAVQYHLAAYYEAFTPEQQEWFSTIPAWFDAVWGTQVVLALFGGAALVLLNRAAVWLFGLSFVLNSVMTLYLLVLSDPSMVSVTGWVGCALMTGSLTLTLLFWLYARGEKQSAKGLL